MTQISDPHPPVVVLAGFMGSGKTAVGRALADRLGVELIDTDELIEASTGMTMPEVFERKGEKKFRELETNICRGLSPTGGTVVATGGGALMNPDTFRRLSAMGTLVLLECAVDACVERLRGKGGRPLLAGAEDDTALRIRIEALLAERRPVYDQVPFHTDTTGRDPEQVAEEIASRLEPGARVIRMKVDVRCLPNLNGADSRDPECQVVIGRGAAARLGWYLQELGLDTRAFLFIPRQLQAELHKRVKPSLEAARIPHEVVPVADGDANKNLAQVRDLLDHLAASDAAKDSVIVSVGGGVTGDVAGFVASTYMRGLPFVQVPTTLVAQVDASIGGKVGVNHPRAKNLIGAIYQPALVLNDPLMLDHLPPREISNGMAEVVKTAIIGSPELFDYVGDATREPAGDKLADPAFLEFCTFESARVKCDIVESDPYEQDLRRILNLGHTMGHALESALDYEVIKHGEAVALGLITAIRVSVRRGRADASFLERTESILRWCGLPTSPPPVDRDLIRRSLKLDKKVKSGTLFFVLPLAPGNVEIVGDVTADELVDAL